MKKTFCCIIGILSLGMLAVSCESTPKSKSIIPDIDVDMTSEEVFAVVGEKYDNCITTETYKNTVEYDYKLNDDEVFDTGLKGYMFFEFESQTDKLVTFGYHFGAEGSPENPVYPCSKEELKAAYDKITETLSEWYGEGELSDENLELNVCEEYTWQDDNKQLWAVYGVNLWGYGEPNSYEEGVNEIVVSCTSKF